jgi:hypothetical protein
LCLVCPSMRCTRSSTPNFLFSRSMTRFLGCRHSFASASCARARWLAMGGQKTSRGHGEDDSCVSLRCSPRNARFPCVPPFLPSCRRGLIAQSHGRGGGPGRSTEGGSDKRAWRVTVRVRSSVVLP